MKILRSRRQSRHGQFLAEACIGLALMVAVWIILTYTLFLADNHIRTAMAARYAAWYYGAGGNKATKENINQYFFYQPLASVEYAQGDGIGNLVRGDNTPSFSDGDGWPTKAKVTFGVTNVSDASNPFPFNMVKTKVPFIPDADVTPVISVSSVCQWDQDSETWTTPGAALSGLWNMLKGIVSSFF
jgi:hypothetical protein